MKISQPRFPSPLGDMLPEPVDLDAIKRRGWQDQHLLVVSDSDERLNPIERQVIRRIGERLFGRPAKGVRHG